MDIPVFCYHNAFADGLEKDLAFLAANGYRTLTASELVDALTEAVPPPPKAVALTFDDGLLSLKTVGLPLLQRYDARATVFAITGLTPEGRTAPTAANHRGPTRGGEGGLGRGDVGRGEHPGGGERDLSRAAGDLGAVGGDPNRLLGWDDLRDLRDSGCFEIGSHGHRHNPVHVGLTEGDRLRVEDYDRLYDMPMEWGPSGDEAAVHAFDGVASRPARPLFATETIIVGDRRLDSREPILQDLRASGAALRERLGIERLHLCLPYGAGTEAIPGLAREASFESVFWSRRPDRRRNEPGDDPYRIVRRKHDFVRRLPGRGRRSLLDLGLAKAFRRLRGDPWA